MNKKVKITYPNCGFERQFTGCWYLSMDENENWTMYVEVMWRTGQDTYTRRFYADHELRYKIKYPITGGGFQEVPFAS